jgi:hypothetical protein
VLVEKLLYDVFLSGFDIDRSFWYLVSLLPPRVVKVGFGENVVENVEIGFWVADFSQCETGDRIEDEAKDEATNGLPRQAALATPAIVATFGDRQ